MADDLGSQFDAKINELHQVVKQELYPCYYDSFAAMDLQDNLLRGIYAYGFEKPIFIQQPGFRYFCEGGNIIQEARSGAERTFKICCRVLQQLDYGLTQCQALVLTPIRESAQQIEKLIRALGEYLPVKVHACVDETSVEEDQRILSAGVHVVVGTPDHVFEMLRRQSLRADHIKIFVVDEADELLLQGSKDQIYDMFQLLPPKVQVGMIFATMPPESSEIGFRFMNRFTTMNMERDELLPEGIKQYYVDLEKKEWKFEMLCDLYDSTAVTQSIIFVNTRKEIDWLTDKLRSLDHTVSVFYKHMDHDTRDISIRKFRSGLSRVLITTDFLSRCIDVQQVPLVINYDLPTRLENYLHRIGIFGRFEKKGFFINFMTSDDEKMFQDIQNVYNVVFEELPWNVADLL